MDARPDDRAMHALFRMLAARVPGSEAAIYATADGAFRLYARSRGFERVPADEGPEPGWRDPSAELVDALDSGVVHRVAPLALALSASDFCALQPFRPVAGGAEGFLVLTATQAGRVEGPVADALQDAAQIAAGLLAGAPRPPPGVRTATEPTPLRSPSLPRAAAHRMIDLARTTAPGPWSILLIDLDRFHAVNAALGEAAGDALLAAIGARLETRLGASDRIARLEGDRFVVLTRRPSEAVGPLAVGLLGAARRPTTLAGRSVVVQASIGVVPAIDDETPTRAVLAQADAALRRAKAEGRNRFVLHEATAGAASLDTSRLELDLAEAPARGQTYLVYQGYVDLAAGRVSGVEALLRWRHPTRGELAPTQFIPLAEATGLILPLGGWALRTALAAAAGWPAALNLSVNVSALQFHQPGFVAEVEAALRATGVAPGRLELEITETVLMRDNPETKAQLDALIAMGVRIALDDFGTGYSALAYLGRLPHHRIKLDRAFVQDLGNPATLDLVRAILALARKTGVDVTAEGVERPDQLKLVRRLGFTHAQGFVTGPHVTDPTHLLTEAQPAI